MNLLDVILATPVYISSLSLPFIALFLRGYRARATLAWVLIGQSALTAWAYEPILRALSEDCAELLSRGQECGDEMLLIFSALSPLRILFLSSTLGLGILAIRGTKTPDSTGKVGK